ncbi:MAG: hypothetical protein ACOYMB_01100 [Patescibacteria group bacterium]
MKKLKESWLIMGAIGFFVMSVVFVVISTAQATYITNYLQPVKVGLPVANTDAATKSYVDTAVAAAGGGLHVYNPVTNTSVGDFIGFSGTIATTTSLQVNTCKQIVWLRTGATVPEHMTHSDCLGTNITNLPSGYGKFYYSDSSCTTRIGIYYYNASSYYTVTDNPGVGIVQTNGVVTSGQNKYFKNSNPGNPGCFQETLAQNIVGVVAINVSADQANPCGASNGVGCYVK